MTEVFSATVPDDAPIVIFARADDPSLSHEYGPTIQRAILSAVLTVDELRRCQFQTYWGSLMLPTFRWARSSAGSEHDMALEHDPFLLWSSACALCRASDGRWSTLSEHVPWVLGTSNVYVGVISRLRSELRASLDEQLQAHSWYIGGMEANLDDPLHQEVFSLIPGWLYSEGWVDQPGGDSIPLEKIFTGTAVRGFSLAGHPLTASQCEIPWSSVPIPPEGQVTLGVLACNNDMIYQELVAAIIDQYQQAERPLSFAVGRQQPLVEDMRGKLHDYALNPFHRQGGKQKAEFFRRELGIEQRDWKLLAIQLISALQSAELKDFRDDPNWGTKQQLRFEISAPVVGLNGKTKMVTAVWKIEDDSPVALVTIFPGKKTAAAVDALDIAPGDWAGLYHIAVAVAERAMEDRRPTPFAVEGPEGIEVIAEGMAGFAWVRFPDARTKFVQWLLHAGHASKSRPGAQISAPSFFVEPAATWAEAMAGVFQAAGHPCSVSQVLD